MPRYRQSLPQLGDELFLTDGGLETTLVFHDGLELPAFAAFTLLRTAEGREHLRRYFRLHAGIARQRGIGFILESATWRANPDWGRKLGYSLRELEHLNREGIRILLDVRRELESRDSPMVISGCIGPRGDGYRPESLMSADEAEEYHRFQVRVFRDTDADMVSAITMTHTGEAVGIVRAARACGMPVAVSFTTETDGRLPSGQSLGEAITEVDQRTGGYAAYYMVNCAHPEHFAGALAEGAPWLSRLKGIRANASRRSHAELDESTELDAGDPQELGEQYHDLVARLGHLSVVGGCCGTDHRHIEEICGASLAARRVEATV